MVNKINTAKCFVITISFWLFFIIENSMASNQTSSSFEMTSELSNEVPSHVPDNPFAVDYPNGYATSDEYEGDTKSDQSSYSYYSSESDKDPLTAICENDPDMEDAFKSSQYYLDGTIKLDNALVYYTHKRYQAARKNYSDAYKTFGKFPDPSIQSATRIRLMSAALEGIMASNRQCRNTLSIL